MNSKQFKKLIRECIKEVINDLDNLDTLDATRAAKEFNVKHTIQNLDSFTKQYIATGLWSSTDDNGRPLDEYEINNIDLETLQKIISDCKDFQTKYEKLYREGGWDDEQAGHDFWLTRNGHGAGFWDRRWFMNTEEIGKKLTQAAKQYRSYELYVGDGEYDGIIFGN